MNIVLLKQKNGSGGIVEFNTSKVVFVLILFLVVFPAIFVYTGYKLGYEFGVSPVYSNERPSLVNRVLDPKYKSKYENRFQTYENQMNALEDVQKSLSDLKKFVSSHEKKLRIEQDMLEHILNQQQTLKPMLKADQEIIDAIFKIQADKYRSQKWIDHLIGFLVGIAASLVATIIYILAKKYFFVVKTEEKGES